MNYPYKKIDFPHCRGALTNGAATMDISWPELVWSAATVGRRHYGDVIRHGRFSALEMKYRIIMLSANLKELNQQLVRTKAFMDLDPSEKGAISFFIGQVIAKHVAHKLFQTPWLMHLDRYRDHFNIQSWSGKEKPDFIGLSQHHDWLVLEAKGRSNYTTDALARSAKSQTRRIRSIDGNMPQWRVSTVSHFSYDNLCATICDPDGFDQDAEDLSFPKWPDFFRLYYEPFIRLVRGEQATKEVSRQDRNYTLIHLNDLDMSVGIDAGIVRNFGNDRLPEVVTGVAKDFYNSQELVLKDVAYLSQTQMDEDEDEDLSENEFWGPDGIVIQLGQSWSNELMTKEPAQRI